MDGTNCRAFTADGLLQGSLGYLAPEQARSSEYSRLPSVDVWGLAATLYRLLTGTTPVRNENWFVFVEDLSNPDRIPVRKLNPSVSADLESVCMKGLQFFPGDRYSSVAQFADDLQNVIDDLPVVARPISRFKRTLRWAKREPVVAGLTSVIVIGLLVSSIVFWSLLRTARVSLYQTQETLEKSLANIYDEHKLAASLLPASPGSMSYRIARLESTIQLNQELLKVNPDDKDIQYRLHVNQFQLAELLPNKGRMDEAREMVASALIN
jgi:serine/threonine protein kinase